jgi:two-component system, chemotaxis family, chemotaxis protein CheY
MKRILFIEDDEPLCTLLSEIFSRYYQVTVINNGFDAWCSLVERGRPDLIVSDINMPMLDGLEFLENLNQSGLYKDIPVVILSGINDEDKRNECLNLGARAFVEKPFEPGMLLETVSRILNPTKNIHAV